MKNKWMMPLSFVAGVLATLLVPVFVLATDAIDMGADVKPGFIERTLAPWGRDRSVAKHAPKEKSPYVGDPAAIATGFDHYLENCVMCHGSPGEAGAELSKGLNRPRHRWAGRRMTPRTESYSGSSNMASG